MATDEHRKFLQYFLYKPLLSAKEFEKVIQAVLERRPDRMEDYQNNLVRSLNDLLKPAQLAIKSRKCEDTYEEYFALINLIESEASKHTFEFTAPELELFKWIMKEIISTDSGSVSSIDCINQSSNIQKLSKTDAQTALDKFLSSHWLKEKEGEVSFTVRALLELEPLLKQLDDELEDCKICSRLAVKKVVCPEPSCGIKVHRHCLLKFSERTSMKCPVCKRPWGGLDEETSSSSTSQGSSQTPVRNGGGRRRPRSVTSDSD